MAIRASLSGIHARSENLVRATRDFDRSRITNADLARAQAKDAKELIALQKRIGIEPLADGQFTQADLFRPFAEGVKGLSVGPLTRYFDNNTFYKQPIVNGPLAPGKSVLKAITTIEKTGAWKAFLPSPYAFAKMVEDRHYGSSSALISAFADVLLAEAQTLVKAGAKWIQFTDPAICVLPPDQQELSALRSAISRIVDAIDATTVYHTQFGNAGPLLPTLDDLPVDYLGVDLYQTPLSELKHARIQKGLQAGIVDARTSVVETPADLVRIARELLDIGARDLVLTSNCELEFVPRVLADKKLTSLATAAKKLAKLEASA
jgi:5-methyltetrahydropteroyltriglutamate--homocysteine methyltransferase